MTDILEVYQLNNHRHKRPLRLVGHGASPCESNQNVPTHCSRKARATWDELGPTWTCRACSANLGPRIRRDAYTVTNQ